MTGEAVQIDTQNMGCGVDTITMNFRDYINENLGGFNRRSFIKGVGAAANMGSQLPAMLDSLTKMSGPLQVRLSYGVGGENPRWFGPSFINRSLGGVLKTVGGLLGGNAQVGYQRENDGIEVLASADPRKIQQFIAANKGKIRVKNRVETIQKEYATLQKQLQELEKLGPTRYTVKKIMGWGGQNMRPPKVDRDQAHEMWTQDRERLQSNIAAISNYLAKNPIDLRIYFFDSEDSILDITNNNTGRVGSYILHDEHPANLRPVSGMGDIMRAAVDQYVDAGDWYGANKFTPEDIDFIRQYDPEKAEKITGIKNQIAQQKAKEAEEAAAEARYRQEVKERQLRRREDERIKRVQGNQNEPSIRDQRIDQQLGMHRFRNTARYGGMHQNYDAEHDPIDPMSFKSFLRSVERPY